MQLELKFDLSEHELSPKLQSSHTKIGVRGAKRNLWFLASRIQR
jgi:hypothetical protein